ncbi:uncharacterized protein LOC129958120 [Argiope bruennichi]|uniref:Uncharacterized protein n=1 Tax=Argiope bruennichi TaxID=94029 RepID=A0A8T0F523_ARGBR|nr:uncharacterized protein LOC129958120 [Argiope bruennichi]KAF8784509.1 hypothetical protein HNY73_010177 [Argiope bruennichi]
MVSVSTVSNDRSRQKWYRRRPFLVKAVFTDLQNGSYAAAVYSIVESAFMIILAIFDIYCLAEAQPGSVHYRYFGISFLFVYSGNQHVRNLLIFCSVVSFVLAVCLMATSVILMKALKKEFEGKFRPWLLSMLIFTIWRVVAIFYRSIVNDLYFGYHQAMLIIWILLIGFNVFMWLIVMSNYQELADITRLEDMAKLKMGTMSSLNQSHSLSRHSVDSVKQQSFSRHSDDSTKHASNNTRSTTPKSSASTNSA